MRVRLITQGAAVMLVFGAVATSDAAASPQAFQVFQHRVCRIARKQNNAAAPYILQFNNYYYNEAEHTPENLRIAGHYFGKVNQIWRSYVRRIQAVPAPANVAQLWRRVGREERAVLRVNRRMVEALDAADNPHFEELEKRDLRLQARRNQTWERIGLYCA